MKISEGIKLKGRPAIIPDCSRDDLPEFFLERGFTTGVEVGVFEGHYTEVLAKSGLKIYGVDPWLTYDHYGQTRGQEWLDERYEKTLKRLEPYPNVTLIRKTSMDAVEEFEPKSIDFVYIDGNHQFKYVAEDMWEWWLRLKDGGVMAGHDYAYFKKRYPERGGCQVHELVDAWSKSYDMDFWVLGRKRPDEGEIRDRFRSWMFIK